MLWCELGRQRRGWGKGEADHVYGHCKYLRGSCRNDFFVYGAGLVQVLQRVDAWGLPPDTCPGRRGMDCAFVECALSTLGGVFAGTAGRPFDPCVFVVVNESGPHPPLQGTH